MLEETKLPTYRYIYFYEEAPTEQYLPEVARIEDEPSLEDWRDEFESNLDGDMIEAYQKNQDNVITINWEHPADKLLRALIRFPDEFRLGYDEGDGDVGITYEDDNAFERNEAYDMGRAYRRGKNS